MIFAEKGFLPKKVFFRSRFLPKTIFAEKGLPKKFFAEKGLPKKFFCRNTFFADLSFCRYTHNSNIHAYLFVQNIHFRYDISDDGSIWNLPWHRIRSGISMFYILDNNLGSILFWTSLHLGFTRHLHGQKGQSDTKNRRMFRWILVLFDRQFCRSRQLVSCRWI